MRWFRFYTNVVNDPKVQRLPPAQFKAWVNTLCVAAERDGDVPDVPDLAFRLRMSESDAEELLNSLTESRLIDRTPKGKMRPHDWASWQYKSDTSTERVNRYRERMKAASPTTTSYLRHREYLLQRDCGSCIYCGSKKSVCIDHVVPVLLGGDDDPMNLAISCKSCNARKAGRTPDQAGMEVMGEEYAKIYQLNVSRLQSDKCGDGVQQLHNGWQRLHETPPEQSRTETEQIQTPIVPRGDDSTPSLFGEVVKRWDSKWFAEFWKEYPLKVAKAAAEKKYRAMVKSADVHDKIMRGLRSQLKELESRERKYIPHPTTWLNQGRWEDEQGTSNAPAQRTSGYLSVDDVLRARQQG